MVYHILVAVNHAPHQPTGKTGRTEHFVAGCLTGQVDRSLYHILRLLRCHQSNRHHDSSPDKKKDRCSRWFIQHAHHVSGRIRPRSSHEILIRRKTGQRHTDEIHQVIPGKGHG